MQHISDWSGISRALCWGDQGHVHASGFQMEQTGPKAGSEATSGDAPEASDLCSTVRDRSLCSTAFSNAIWSGREETKKIPCCFFWKAGQTVERLFKITRVVLPDFSGLLGKRGLPTLLAIKTRPRAAASEPALNMGLYTPFIVHAAAVGRCGGGSAPPSPDQSRLPPAAFSFTRNDATEALEKPERRTGATTLGRGGGVMSCVTEVASL